MNSWHHRQWIKQLQAKKTNKLHKSWQLWTKQTKAMQTISKDVLSQSCKYAVICSTNRIPGPGSKIHYLVPNPNNWYPFLHWLLLTKTKKCNFGLSLHLLMWWLWLPSICCWILITYNLRHCTVAYLKITGRKQKSYMWHEAWCR